MKDLDDIERSIKNLRVRTSAAADERILRDASAALARYIQKRHVAEPSSLRTTAARIGWAKLVAAAVLVFAGFGLLYLATNGDRGTAFAEVLEQIEKAKTITWKVTFYNLATSHDGKRTWVRTETRQIAYKAPGLYREEGLDDNMQVRWVEIRDSAKRKKLSWSIAKKTATLSESPFPGYSSGPFAAIKKNMSEHPLEWVGKKRTSSGEVNAFRQGPTMKGDWSNDIWIDARTKQLVAYYAYDPSFYDPGDEIYDPKDAPAYKTPTPPDKDWSMTGMCWVFHDINFDADLDESLFRLEPPEGYIVKSERHPTVTEEEMIEYLGILADCNDKTFPDKVWPFAFSSERTNKIVDKPKEERTAAEQKLVETMHHYILAGLNAMPIRHFVWDHAVEGTFRYIGKGVKLGDGDRIVCWYKLKITNTYRAVYGDLSVKDVAAEDLPLSVEP